MAVRDERAQPRSGQYQTVDTSVLLASSPAAGAQPEHTVSGARVRRRRTLLALLGFSDLALAVVAVKLADAVVSSGLRLPAVLMPSTRMQWPVTLVWAPTLVVVLCVSGAYRFTYQAGVYSLARLVLSVLLAGGVLSSALYFTDSAVPTHYIALLLVVTCFVLVVTHALFRRVATGVSALRRRVLVIGSGDAAESTARMIERYRHRGLELVGMVAPTGEVRAAHAGQASAGDGEALWGPPAIAMIEALVRTREVDDVVIARSWSGESREDVERCLYALRHLPAQIYVTPDYKGLMIRASVEDFGGVTLVNLSELSLPAWQMVVKRLFDVLVSLVLIVVLSPLMLAVAAAIRLTSPGPVIFRQQRVGRHHRLFTIYKFRSMYDGGAKAASPTPPGAPHKSRGDPRITPVGRILRRASLDELPQLYNVLFGQMSLVGPRPELPAIVAHYEPWQYARLVAPPGITGWWQVNGRGERLLHLHTEDDIFYVRNFSLWLDARILFMTIKAVITGTGAF
ncbi:MAG: sugar transferase [Ktedonobacterales bacterium]